MAQKIPTEYALLAGVDIDTICQHDNGLEEINDYEGGCADCGAIVAIVQDHAHTYRRDISDWWCAECDTITDYCRQINPY